MLIWRGARSSKLPAHGLPHPAALQLRAEFNFMGTQSGWRVPDLFDVWYLPKGNASPSFQLPDTV